MGPKENRDVIEGCMQARRETERKEKLLMEEIDCLRSKRAKIAEEERPQNEEELRCLDLQIDNLRKEIADQKQARSSICKTARTFTAGD